MSSRTRDTGQAFGSSIGFGRLYREARRIRRREGRYTPCYDQRLQTWIFRRGKSVTTKFFGRGLRRSYPTVFASLLATLVLSNQATLLVAFRLVDENGTFKPFAPYEEGFVGRFGDPFTTFVSDRVNEGAPGTPTYPRLFEGVYPRQICPGMVGPMDDGKYYCLGREHGYCDRRSGTCFCNVGYQGISCHDCSPTHYPEGDLCYPKLLCPNECSGAGTCHYSNGTCSCLPHRVGDDCSLAFCPAVFSPRCKECTFERCTACESGYYVDGKGGRYSCLPCDGFDPRCTRCNEEACLECTDPVLLSGRRSGLRAGDPELPFDELERELPYALEFGTQDPRFFAAAEVFEVVTRTSSPLNQSSVTCAQGVHGDDTWTCEGKPVSHRVCGHPGTISFSSPEYEAYEDPTSIVGRNFRPGGHGTANGTARITVMRTGGGYGTVGVSYRLRHGTTDNDDVTAHAHYTTSKSLLFSPGVVELSFLVGVHQDGRAEENEYFDLLLYQPWGGARLGAQHRTRVIIVDTESTWNATDARMTVLEGQEEHALELVAGTTSNYTLVSRDAHGQARGIGGDVFAVWVDGREIPDSDGSSANMSDVQEFDTEVAAGQAVIAEALDLGGGNYTVRVQVDVAGGYFLRLALCRAGGLAGRYYGDSFFDAQKFERVDRVMNLTWGSGPIAGTSTDFAGVVWTGRIRPDVSEMFELEVGTGIDGSDAARLWIDGDVVIDGFERGGSIYGWAGLEDGLGGGGRGRVNLTSGSLHDITIEFSERRGDASFHLAWSSPSVSYGIVPAENLYWCREVGTAPRTLNTRSAETNAAASEAFGVGLVSSVAAVPATFKIVPRDAFGNLRSDEIGPSVTPYDLFTVTLEATNADPNVYSLDGVYGSAGSGGRIVSGSVQFAQDEGAFHVEYTPFVTGMHSLNVTFQEGLFEPKLHIEGSPFPVTVSPGKVFGRRSFAWGEALRDSTAGITRNLHVLARDVVGNIIRDGGSELAVYAFHREAEEYARGDSQDLENGSYVAALTPTVAGPYHVSVALDNQEVAESPYAIVVSPGKAHGPSSSVYGLGVSAAVATLDNTIYVQARDDWGNNLWSPYFNVTVRMFPISSSPPTAGNQRARSPNDTEYDDDQSIASFSVAFLGNASGIAMVTYVPTEAGDSFLYVSVDGLDVSGSPFIVRVSGGPASGANATVSGSALALATAGENSSLVIQARDREANPTISDLSDRNAFDRDDRERRRVFNVTLTRRVNSRGDESNSTPIQGVVDHVGEGRYTATYNATEAGNYSLEVVDVSDGQHAIGSPFDVLVQPAQAFASSTLVWWDRQVAGENVVYLQAVDFWGNNLTHGGDVFEVHWVSRGTDRPRVVTLDSGETLLTGAVEGTFSEEGADRDTASTASGFPSALDRKRNIGEGASDIHEDNTPAAGAYVTDLGNGVYEVRTDSVAGFYWLEVGLVEPGGLWGTYYADGGVESGGTYRTKEAEQRTKGAVDFDWGFASPVDWIDHSGASLASTRANFSVTLLGAGMSVGVPDGNLSTPAAPAAGNNSAFPVDYFSARFSGYVKASLTGEYTFMVRTDRSSGVALLVSGRELFSDLVLRDESRSTTSSAYVAKVQPESTDVAVGLERKRTVHLVADRLTPLQLHYSHGMGRAALSLAWLSRTEQRLSVVSPTSLYHLRPGWKIAVDLNPAATAAGASTTSWPPPAITTKKDGASAFVDAEPKSAIAGKVLEVIAQTRDAYGNLRMLGGDSVQAYAAGPGGVLFHGSVLDNDTGNYTLTFWPVVAGAYQLSVLISPLEESRWALGYRSVEQAMAGAHVVGSPFRVLIVEGQVAANTSTASGSGITSCIVGGAFGSSVFTIRAQDSMGNRVSSGSTGLFDVRVFESSAAFSAETDGDAIPVAVGTAVYTGKGGVYRGDYNVTTAGNYSLHVTLMGSQHIAGSPFAVSVVPGAAVAEMSTCENCGQVLKAANFSATSTKTVRLIARDIFGNALDRGGENWYVSLEGEEASPETGRRRVIVADRGDGTYKVATTPGAAGRFELRIILLSKTTQTVAGVESGNSGGGGLSAKYFSNVRLLGRPFLERVDPTVHLDWGAGAGSGYGISKIISKGASVGVRWDGFLKAPSSETFVFTISMGADDETRLWVDGVLLINKSSTSSFDLVQPAYLADETVEGSVFLVARATVRVRVEYVHHGTGGKGAGRSARLLLHWRSPSVSAQEISLSNLFPGGADIVGSPFKFDVH